MIADKKHLKAIDKDTGRRHWSFDAGGSLHVQPILDLGDRVVIQQTFGEKQLIAVDDAGKLLWAVPFEKAVRDKNRKIVTPEDTGLLKSGLAVKAAPDGHPSLLFAADARSLKCVGAADGKQVWSSPIEGVQTLLLSGDRLIAADDSDVIHFLDAANGTERWQYQAPKGVSQLARLGDGLLVTLYSKELVVLGIEDGKPRETAIKRGDPYRLVPDGNNRVLICSESGTFVLTPAGTDKPGKPAPTQ